MRNHTDDILMRSAMDTARNGEHCMKQLKFLYNAAIHSKDEIGNIKVNADSLMSIIALYDHINKDILGVQEKMIALQKG